MLGKLIKYDLKYAAKIFLLIHGAYLVVCFLMRFLFLDRMDFSDGPEKLVVPITLLILIFVFLIAAVSLATSLLIALRFYRNMFSREGYLSWTLPASPSRHLLAKFCSGYLITAADIVVVSLGLVLLLTGSNVTGAYGSVAVELEDYLGAPLKVYMLKLFLFTLIFTFASVVQIYFSIALGQLFASHRVLFALAFYFLTSIVMQVISSLLALMTGLSKGWFSEGGGGFSLGQYTDSLYMVTGIMYVVLAIAEYIVTYYIMKRRVNLI